MRSAESARRRWLRWVWAAIAAAAAWFAWRQFAQTDWNAVGRALARHSPWTLAGVGALALASHGLYALLDVVGARQLGLRPRGWRIWRTATVSYAFNLNLGALIGGVGSRYRLYLQQDVSLGDTTRLIALSMAGNWIGYAALLATMATWGDGHLLSRWTGTRGALALSVGLALSVLAYFIACARGFTWHLRGRRFAFPPLPMALLQSGIGTANWTLMGCILWLCLPPVPYPDALGALLAAAVAGAATHVPGGWGVLDYVLVSTLHQSASRHELVAAVLVYRAAYYLLPLVIALVNWVAIERGAKSR
jgi:uncharacterized membrane protein YbhN (UPF0104 family)